MPTLPSQEMMEALIADGQALWSHRKYVQSRSHDSRLEAEKPKDSYGQKKFTQWSPCFTAAMCAMRGRDLWTMWKACHLFWSTVLPAACP